MVQVRQDQRFAHVPGMSRRALLRRAAGAGLATPALASLGSSIRHVAAADSTPGVDGIGDYPELMMISTDTALTLPEAIGAGRYLVTIENQSTLGESAPNIIALPEGISVDAFLAEPADPETGLPPWFLTATIIGAPVTPMGTTARAIVDIPAGRYAIWGEPYQPARELEVTTGQDTAIPGVVPDVVVSMSEGVLTGVPAREPRGPRIWQVESTGAEPHRFQLYGYPGAITRDDLMVALEGMAAGEEPEPGAPDLSLAEQLGGFGVQSAGQIGWPVLDLTPGTYIALCTLASVPHFLTGEVAVFTVDEGPIPGGTPTG